MRRSLIVLTAALLAGAAPALAQDKSIVVASTTSTQDSGLFGHILPIFKAKSGIDVKVVAQGTGQALDTGRRGDADVHRLDALVLVCLVHVQPGDLRPGRVHAKRIARWAADRRPSPR